MYQERAVACETVTDEGTDSEALLVLVDGVD